MAPGLSLLLVPLFAAAAMATTWWRQRTTRDAGPVDLVWTLGVGAAALFHAATSGGWGPRRALVALLVGLWAARLAGHLAKRLAREPEDGRYAALRARLGARADAWFFVFFQVQGLLVAGLGLVFFVLCRSELAGWRASDALALALYCAALIGESLADRDLARWRAEPENRGRTCRAGLWRYSRHPNYFFEWLHWLVYPLLGLGLEHGAWLWLAPLAMYLLVVHVTGIPPAEAQALRSRGDDYRRYQATTNAFFPGPARATQGA
jgi:steroid 5-alpha reductase family enzyme